MKLIPSLVMLLICRNSLGSPVELNAVKIGERQNQIIDSKHIFPGSNPPDNLTNNTEPLKEKLLIAKPPLVDNNTVIEVEIITNLDKLPEELTPLKRHLKSIGARSSDEDDDESDSVVDTQDWLNAGFLWGREGTEMSVFTTVYMLKYPDHKGKIILTATGTAIIIILAGLIVNELGKELPERFFDSIELATNGVAAWVFLRWSFTLSKQLFAVTNSEGGNAQATALNKKDILLYITLPVVVYTAREAAEGSIGTLKLIATGHFESLLLILIPIIITTTSMTVTASDRIPYLRQLPCSGCKVGGGRSYMIVGSLVFLNLFGAGRISDAAHEYDNLVLETPVFWDANNKTVISDYDIWSENRLPMALFSLIGYRAKATLATTMSWVLYSAGVAIMDISLIVLTYKASQLTRQEGSTESTTPISESNL